VPACGQFLKKEEGLSGNFCLLRVFHKKFCGASRRRKEEVGYLESYLLIGKILSPNGNCFFTPPPEKNK